MDFQYAGFVKRFIAGIVDSFVFLPLMVLYFWLGHQSRAAAYILTPITLLSYSAYSIYFHARYGQTIGKMAAGIRVLKTDGQPISLREALMRSSVDLTLGVFTCAGTLVAISALHDETFSRLGFLGFTRIVQDNTPPWAHWTSNLETYWYWSEVIVVIFNRKRRALHDFIAGTIVIVEPKPQMEHFEPRPPSTPPEHPNT